MKIEEPRPGDARRTLDGYDIGIDGPPTVRWRDEDIRRSHRRMQEGPDQQLFIPDQPRMPMGGTLSTIAAVQWRLRLARAQLLETRETVAMVAKRAGYQSEAAFGRAFKQLFGVPPGGVRKLAA